MKAGGRIMSAAPNTKKVCASTAPRCMSTETVIESVADDPRLQPGVRAVGRDL